MTYSILQWMMFFYIYCFLGWVWETMYVSVIKMHWVNRGFMHGPFLPIYGAGFTGMVMLTSNLRGIYWAEYIVGMIGATIMEYYTGYFMEQLFKVRYWDYNNKKFNLRGYICLEASLLWGVFAILGPEVVHPVIEKLVFFIPQNLLEILVLFLTGYCSADFCGSFKEALDFKELLVSLTARNEELAKIEKGLSAVSEFVNGELKETSEAGLRKINNSFTEGKNVYIKKTEQIGELKDRLVDTLERIKQIPGEIEFRLPESISIQKLRDEIEDDLSRINLIERTKANMHNRRSVKKSVRIIKGNPSVVSNQYQDALNEMKTELQDNKK